MSRTQYRILVSSGLILFFTAFFIPYDLPPELLMYLDTQARKEINSVQLAFTFIAAVTVIANIGLLFFYRWAKLLFTLGVLITTVGMVFFDPVVNPPIKDVINGTTTLIDGMIISLMYFSNISYEFTKKNT